MQIFVNYIIPNVMLFGGIYLVAKYVENSVWYYIENYDEATATLEDFKKKFTRS